MLTAFQWIFLLAILAATFAGGFYPLFQQDRAKGQQGFPMGEAFTAGVFLALALTLMLPSGLHLLSEAFPEADYPIASLMVTGAFLLLLGLEHVSCRIEHQALVESSELSPASIPVIMTIMIAIPSFFLGTALGVSPTETAIFIFVAIMLHKSSAAFALALKMVRSTLTRGQVWLTFCLFASATPLGIVTGEEVHRFIGESTMIIIKGLILSSAAGTFLFMATLHEFRAAPMIKYCTNRRGFAALVVGFTLTAFVRFLIGEAHKVG